ncbi:MAG: methyltransferase domain-containing protein [Halomonadaceae bacterium]|nr:methyltransferase domain-containing protein [Halomonadaceae bacterium]
MSTTAEKLTDHYDAASARSGQSLQERLREAFRDAGRDPERLSLADVAGIDQLHLGGRSASRMLAELGGLKGGEQVLDVGCGTGGASRLLATEYDCHVVGVDITAAFVEVAGWLSLATGLAEQTRFSCADAARVPLEAGTVEVVWCQHALMNMPHIPQVLAEWRRLLVPGGRILLHEIVAGGNLEPLALPVPWARTSDSSYLRESRQLQRILALSGFKLVELEDVTAQALAWRQHHVPRETHDKERQEPEPMSALPGPALIFGEEFAQMGRNLRDNLAADKVRVVAGVWRLGQA